MPITAPQKTGLPQIVSGRPFNVLLMLFFLFAPKAAAAVA